MNHATQQGTRQENQENQDIPALFLPGWGFGVRPLQNTLAKTRWRPLPLPGAEPGEEIPATFAAARDRVLASLPPVCHLGGWSLGAMLALACAGKAPGRILTLSLVAATPSFIRREHWDYGRPPGELQAFMDMIKSQGASLLPRFAGSFCRGDACEQAAASLVGSMQAMPQAALERGLEWLYEADLREEAGSISCPVTLLHGENDPLIVPEAARWLAARLPRARLVLMPGRAHAPFAGDDAAFLQELPKP
ncbi:MAG: alpha/beta hydrolase [Zoogloeaceae bacterium]|jgi:pimeloyl-[acyl-carrier protein] methyl ester esterase|nr:alpha/beta hydrolase [Zoogloeaceae bacterium]